MKHTLYILFVLTLLSFVKNSYSQEDERWKLITTDRNRFIYLDSKTIENKENENKERFIQCWLKEIPTKKEFLNDKEIKYIMKNSVFYCSERKIKFIEAYTYFRDNTNTLDTVAVTVNTIVPESLSEILFNFVCK
jgi:uncharacterized protein with ParB-like and HNH nuclease domain